VSARSHSRFCFIHFIFIFGRLAMERKYAWLVAAAGMAAGAANADYTVQMNAIDIKGVGSPIGTVTIAAAPGGGVVLTPALKALPPGTHGFHVHEFANCGAKEKDGKMSPGEMAGSHFDPDKTGKHAGPTGQGHKGDLPLLDVAASGEAKQAVTAKRLSLGDLKNKSLVIHQGGDTYSEPPPSGGGGTRIACGLIEAAAKK
jgi:Cu-Zn family superoxide dismutase